MKQITDSLSDIAVFVQVVEVRSFTAAAERLGLAKSAVSKAVTRLEDRLGVRLLHRTTRRLSLTEEGERLHQRSARALDEIRDAERELSTRQLQPRGQLRVAAPMSFGVLQVAGLMPAFLRAHPLLRVDLRLEDGLTEVVGGGFDLSLRIAELADSSFIARRLATIHHVTVASPAYLSARGLPRHPAELRKHDCLVYSYRMPPGLWRYHDDDGAEIAVQVDGALQANNSLALRAALIAGAGIALTPSFVVGDDLRAARLVQVLEGFGAPARGLYAMLPERRNLSAKTRAFVDFLAAQFGDPPAWDRGLLIAAAPRR